MTSLVARFEKDLGISQKEARGKVIRFYLVLACMVLTVAIPLRFFPYTSSYTQNVGLLYGNHQQVEQIRGGEVFLSRNDFGKMLDKAEPSFMAVHEYYIDYMTKVDGISYQYIQQVEYDANYIIYSSYVKDGYLVRDMRRNGIPILSFVLLPLIFMFLFKAAIDSILSKEESGRNGKTIRRRVWRS